MDKGTTETDIVKTQSEAFLNIRAKIQGQMKKQNVTYGDILKSIDKDSVEEDGNEQTEKLD